MRTVLVAFKETEKNENSVTFSVYRIQQQRKSYRVRG